MTTSVTHQPARLETLLLLLMAVRPRRRGRGIRAPPIARARRLSAGLLIRFAAGPSPNSNHTHGIGNAAMRAAINNCMYKPLTVAAFPLAEEVLQHGSTAAALLLLSSLMLRGSGLPQRRWSCSAPLGFVHSLGSRHAPGGLGPILSRGVVLLLLLLTSVGSFLAGRSPGLPPGTRDCTAAPLSCLRIASSLGRNLPCLDDGMDSPNRAVSHHVLQRKGWRRSSHCALRGRRFGGRGRSLPRRAAAHGEEHGVRRRRGLVWVRLLMLRLLLLLLCGRLGGGRGRG